MKYLWFHTKNKNINDDIADVSDLPYDEMCVNIGINNYMTLRLVSL